MKLNSAFVSRFCTHIENGAPPKLACAFLGMSYSKLQNHLADAELILESGANLDYTTEYNKLCVRLYQKLAQSRWAFVGPAIAKLHQSADTKALTWIAEKYMPEYFGKAAEGDIDVAKQIAPLIINTQPKELGNGSYDSEQADVSTTVDARHTTDI